MALGFINDATLTDIAGAIREKKEISDLMFPNEMAELIRSIETGVPLPSWITEIDFTSAYVSSDTQTMSVPTVLTSAPQNWWLATTYAGGNTAHDILVSSAKCSLVEVGAWASKGSTKVISIDENGGASASFANGVVTFSGRGGTYGSWFGAGRSYSILMWR